MGRELGVLPGVGDVVGIVSSGLGFMPEIDGTTTNPNAAKNPVIGGIDNVQNGIDSAFTLMIVDGGSLTLAPTGVTQSVLWGVGTTQVSVDAGSSFNIKGPASLELRATVSLIGNTSSSIGTVNVTNGASLTDDGSNTISCNMVVGDTGGTSCVFNMLAGTTASTTWKYQVQMTIKSGSALFLPVWSSAGGVELGFLDGNINANPAATIVN